MIELRAADVTCLVSPEDGGRIAALRVGAESLLVERPSPGADPIAWGSFPMVPWCGRLRHGRFMFDGQQVQVPVNFGAHAIHGTGYTQEWQPEEATASEVTMSLPLGPTWPFGGLARQRILLDTDTLTCELSVTATDQSMPIQVGWHPWFVKPAEARIEFRRMYPRDAEGIPTGDLIAAPPGPWDDCFVEPLHAPVLFFESTVLTVESDCDHWVIFDEPAHSTCVEPQSGPPDGFTVAPCGLAGGETFTRWMSISWTRI